LYSSTGVGTVTMKMRQARKASRSWVIAQLPGGGQGGGADLAGAVVARLQFRDAPGVDVEADHGAVLAEFDRERQADVAQADDGARRYFQAVADATIPITLSTSSGGRSG
jgi:hypothetical protein